MPLGISPLVNFAFVKLFASEGNEPILIAFLNAILQLRHPIVSIQLKNPYNPKDFQDDKLTILDVKAADSEGRIFHVEMQTLIHAAFARRIVYYFCEILLRPVARRRLLRALETGLLDRPRERESVERLREAAPQV